AEIDRERPLPAVLERDHEVVERTVEPTERARPIEGAAVEALAATRPDLEPGPARRKRQAAGGANGAGLQTLEAVPARRAESPRGASGAAGRAGSAEDRAYERVQREMDPCGGSPVCRCGAHVVRHGVESTPAPA